MCVFLIEGAASVITARQLFLQFFYQKAVTNTVTKSTDSKNQIIWV